MAKYSKAAPRGWYSRGYLPHCDASCVIQFITFRLYDALPNSVIDKWKEELGIKEAFTADDKGVAELRKKILRYEDAGYGACYLKHPEIAGLVQNVLLHFDGQRYRLLAWCIMPNHVHVLIESLPEHPLSALVHSWKSFAANAANRLLNIKGAFWSREYYDRYIRSDNHLLAVKEYIHNNPVKAGLTELPELWAFGSAKYAVDI
jgi:REP element-mobilizing transposase RayT